MAMQTFAPAAAPTAFLPAAVPQGSSQAVTAIGQVGGAEHREGAVVVVPGVDHGQRGKIGPHRTIPYPCKSTRPYPCRGQLAGMLAPVLSWQQQLAAPAA